MWGEGYVRHIVENFLHPSASDIAILAMELDTTEERKDTKNVKQDCRWRIEISDCFAGFR